jgi:hypothetical protein
MDEQKHYFDIANLTESLTVSQAWYTEYEPKVPDRVIEKFGPPGIYRHYRFIATNSSEKVIEVIAVSHRKDNLSGLGCKYFKHDRGLKPQETTEVGLRSVKPGSSVAIEAVVFSDGTYEGQQWVAEGILTREAASKTKMIELMTLFKERGLLFPQTDTVIADSAKEMKALADEEIKRYKARNTFQDHQESSTHLGAQSGIQLTIMELANVEHNPNQEGMRHFIARISLLTGTDITDK